MVGKRMLKKIEWNGTAHTLTKLHKVQLLKEANKHASCKMAWTVSFQVFNDANKAIEAFDWLKRTEEH